MTKTKRLERGILDEEAHHFNAKKEAICEIDNDNESLKLGTM